MSVHLFGIRHHGVGSSRSLLAALNELKPDCILIEGPPDANDLIPLINHPEMHPPVALLVYNPDQPQRAAWYPFAIYSPEWQAICFGLRIGADVRFMDLPQKHMLGLQNLDDNIPPADQPVEFNPDLVFDPLGTLATIAGDMDGENWWGRVVEETDNPSEVFDAIHQAMTALRDEYLLNPSPRQYQESLREAWMRTTIRSVEKIYSRIAVVCGAWHTPALIERKKSKTADSALLKNLPTVKTVATFAPWTYSRLTLMSGYGAGIISPGWYHHLWETPITEVVPRWLGRVATLLREEGMMASTAQVIDALQLAQMLALMRGRTVSLDELNEATIAVFCGGQTEPLALIRNQLIVSNRLGTVPPETPVVPLKRDLSQQQKKLRLTVTADTMTLDLDLRQPTDLARSHLFHRLNMLNILWARENQSYTRRTGTFHEYWMLSWQAEIDIQLIEASIWGNTIEGAVVAFAQHHLKDSQTLSSVTHLLNKAILSDLSTVVHEAIQRLHTLSSVTYDIAQLIDAVPPLVETLRYGDVRKTDASLIAPVLESVVVRICIGLYPASLNLDDEAAVEFYERIIKLHNSLQLINDSSLLTHWYKALHLIVAGTSGHSLLVGLATRLLFRAEQMAVDQVKTGMRRAFSIGNNSLYSAYWLEGFLSGMEHTLLRNEALLTLVDEWVIGLSQEQFHDVVPLLRRTFSTFDAPARRNLSQLIAHGTKQFETETIDEARVSRVLPLLRQVLGI